MPSYTDGDGRQITPVAAVGSTKTITVTPPLDTSAYASGDHVGGLMTFAGAFRATGAGGTLHAIEIIDGASQSASLDLFIFDQSVTPNADNTPFHVTDADMAKLVGVVASGAYYSAASNCATVMRGLGLSIAGVSTSLYGLLCSRGTPTYAASSLTVRLTILQD